MPHFLWWSRHRPAARDLLARELETALRTVEYVPRVGRRTRSRFFRDVRRLLLRGTGYHLYYQLSEARQEVRVVYFRHARRRPVP